jgi:chemotaxis protein methyltransferase CheR
MDYSPRFNEAAAQILADLIQERTGLIYENSRTELMIDRLTPLVIDRGLDSFLDYYYLLKYDSGSEKEWRKVETALAVNETYFWREQDQIEAAANIIIPQLQQARPGVPVRVWHAGCATGEEPYSLAIALQRANRFLDSEIEISATDLNQEALARARAGIYRLRSFRSMPQPIFDAYFTKISNQQFLLADDIRAKVHFSHLNLVDQKVMALKRNYDIIFCRNVFIYFAPAAIKQVGDSFYDALNFPGYLFVAAAESLLRFTTRFDFTEIGGVLAYMKSDGAYQAGNRR